MEKEIDDMIKLFYKIYNTLGFKGENVQIGLSTRPEKRIGADEI
jgi:threonyl-tRNA synthetase